MMKRKILNMGEEYIPYFNIKDVYIRKRMIKITIKNWTKKEIFKKKIEEFKNKLYDYISNTTQTKKYCKTKLAKDKQNNIYCIMEFITPMEE